MLVYRMATLLLNPTLLSIPINGIKRGKFNYYETRRIGCPRKDGKIPYTEQAVSLGRKKEEEEEDSLGKWEQSEAEQKRKISTN